MGYTCKCVVSSIKKTVEKELKMKLSAVQGYELVLSPGNKKSIFVLNETQKAEEAILLKQNDEFEVSKDFEELALAAYQSKKPVKITINGHKKKITAWEVL